MVVDIHDENFWSPEFASFGGIDNIAEHEASHVGAEARGHLPSGVMKHMCHPEPPTWAQLVRLDWPKGATPRNVRLLAEAPMATANEVTAIGDGLMEARACSKVPSMVLGIREQ